MAELTRNGVCYDVANSPFTHRYRGYEFYFSSESHRRNFAAKAHIRELWLTDSLSRRFHFRVDASLVSVFQLYRIIETRGFHVVREEDGRVYSSASDLSFETVMVDGEAGDAVQMDA